jgi:hypothetical protein
MLKLALVTLEETPCRYRNKLCPHFGPAPGIRDDILNVV